MIKRTLTTLALAAALLGASSGLSGDVGSATGVDVGHRLSDLACTEDMACWDCSTMGNGICGTVTP